MSTSMQQTSHNQSILLLKCYCEAASHKLNRFFATQSKCVTRAHSYGISSLSMSTKAPIFLASFFNCASLASIFVLCLTCPSLPLTASCCTSKLSAKPAITRAFQIVARFLVQTETCASSHLSNYGTPGRSLHGSAEYRYTCPAASLHDCP